MGKNPDHSLLTTTLTAGFAISLIFVLCAWYLLSTQSVTHSPFQAAVPLVSGTPRPVLQQFWQVGAMAGADGFASSGMRTTIRTVAATHLAPQTSDYYWIGSYLADRSFIQAGYAFTADNLAPRWFFCAFDRSLHILTCPMGQPGSAGAVGTWHTYSLDSARHGNRWTWTARMDNQVIGSADEDAGNTGSTTPTIYAEQSAYAPHPATNTLGPVEFRPAFEVHTAADPAGSYHVPSTAYSSYSAADITCPPFGIGVVHANDLLLGSHESCPGDGIDLW